VLYVGKDFASFVAAYGPRNPKADVTLFQSGEAGEDHPSAFDLIVLGPGAEMTGKACQTLLRPGGALAMVGGPTARLPDDCAGVGFALVKARHGSLGSILFAQRPAEAAGGALYVELWAYAPRLMDIRTRLPMEQLNTDPAVTTRFRTAPFGLPDMPLDRPKVVILQRPGAYNLDHLRPFIADALAAGWIPVLEIDDHPELILLASSSNPGPEHAWTTARGVAGVQTSTPSLAEAFRAHNPEVKVFPNAVFELRAFPEGERPRRVFYGAIERGPFAVDVARSLSPTVRQFPDTEFVVVGDRAVFDALPTRHKRFEEYLPYERYLALMRTCSVVLSPLGGRAGEEGKSDAKFLDAAQAGALMIASPFVYRDVVRHGQNGLIARSRDQWAPLLTGALRNQAKRREMARRAWEEVRETRMFADQLAERRDWFLSLWNRREALEQAICERLPGLAEAIRERRR
jgi:hypothetical protein